MMVRYLSNPCHRCVSSLELDVCVSECVGGGGEQRISVRKKTLKIVSDCFSCGFVIV